MNEEIEDSEPCKFQPLIEWLKSRKLAQFNPKAQVRCNAGHTISYMLEDVQYYGSEIDNACTVYRAFDDDRIVGFQLVT